MITELINKVKTDKPNPTQVLIAQIQYLPNWKKEDYLSEFPNLDNQAKYIVQVYQTCRILAKVNGLMDSVWNKYEGGQFGLRIEWINKVQSTAVDMLNEIANKGGD